MDNVLGLWRPASGRGMFMTPVPILIYTVLHHPDWSGLTGGVQAKLDGIPNEALRSQMRGPLTLSALLPTGLLGAFAALMLCASISTLYLHALVEQHLRAGRADSAAPGRRWRLTVHAHAAWPWSAWDCSLRLQPVPQAEPGYPPVLR
ncbi:MAG: hypothetical protein IPG61_18850 [bacterium]|nr:hypothetical protein [bacterium]